MLTPRNSLRRMTMENPVMDQQCPFTGNLCSACIEGACQYRDLSRQLKLKSRALAKKRAVPNLSAQPTITPLPPAPPLWACDGCGTPFATFFELSRHKEKDCLATTPTPPPPLDPPSPPQQTAPIEPLRWGAPAPGEPMWRYGGTKGPVPNWFCDGCGASFETSPELVRHCQTGCPKPLRPPQYTRIRAE